MKRNFGNWTRGLAGALIPVILCLLAASGCYTVPETGRSALMLIDFPTEARLGLQAFADAKSERTVSADPETNEAVRRVGERIAAVADRDIPSAGWEFVVFEDESPNAFAVPGGKVGIHTGILPLTQTDEGLATVMAHEIGHVAARHGAERISEGLVLGVAGTALEGALADDSDRDRQLAMIAYGIGSAVGITLPHSRRAEFEADHIGLMYMARAGYDPTKAIEFWERMAEYGKEQGGGGVPAFLSTHPVDSKRIEQIRRLMPQAVAAYRQTLASSSQGPDASTETVRAVRPGTTAAAGPVRALRPVQR